MIIRLHRNFERQFSRLTKSQRARVRERLTLFLIEPFHPILGNHPLKGKYVDYRSINISGDLRAVFKLVNDQRAVFVAIDTHSKLYS